MMLEILVAHLEKVCGFVEKTQKEGEQPEIKPKSGLLKSMEDTNIEEIL
jgi:hypothetical protein